MPGRLTAAARRRLDAARHRGDTVRCPLCGRGFDRFKDDWNRPGALCWRCGSQERHRAQWLLFMRRPELLGGIGSLLHFAPEWCLRRRLAAAGGFDYVTADRDRAGVDLRLDVTALELADGAFDAVVCSHVLEHVPDDGAAMRELRRVTAAGGWCLVMVPVDLAREHTHEDPGITAPADRLREYRQGDHVRLYALDIGERLTAAGFTVERIDPRAEFGNGAMDRHRLLESDLIWLCRPATTRRTTPA